MGTGEVTDAQRTIENAYLNIGMHRDTEFRRIATENEPIRLADYRAKCAGLDKWVLEAQDSPQGWAVAG